MSQKAILLTHSKIELNSEHFLYVEIFQFVMHKNFSLCLLF